MKQRNLVAMFFLTIITLGIYSLYWQVKTKGEMNSLGAKIPTAWLLIVPLVGIYWFWLYSQGVEKVTGGKLSTPLAFVLMFVLGAMGLGIVGIIIIQSEFNHLADAPAQGDASGAGQWQTPTPVPGQPLPDNSFGGPVAPTPIAADGYGPAATPAQFVPPQQPTVIAPAAPVYPGAAQPPSDPTNPGQSQAPTQSPPQIG